MPYLDRRFAVGEALAGAAMVSLLLAGCNKTGDATNAAVAGDLPALPATLPMSNAPAQPVAYAPPAYAMPLRPIRTVRLADRRAAYAYADQAGTFSQSLGDAPPDYGFDYDGVRPWAWQAYDGSRVFVEPLREGYRYYYYRAGADRPFFIRDPEAAYGYSGDELAVVYGPDGEIIPADAYGPRLGLAAAFLWRSEQLLEASRERRAVSALEWAEREDRIAASREQWAAHLERQADWDAYHAAEAAQENRYWAQEAQRREVDAQRFTDWSRQDFRPAPPPRAIPPTWQRASWAQDSARYAPVAAAAAGAAALALAAHHQRAASFQSPLATPPQPFHAAAYQRPLPLAPEHQVNHGPLRPVPRFAGPATMEARRGEISEGPMRAPVQAVHQARYTAPPPAAAAHQRSAMVTPRMHMHASRPTEPLPQQYQAHFAGPRAPERPANPHIVERVTVHHGSAPQFQAPAERPREARPEPARERAAIARPPSAPHPEQAHHEPSPQHHQVATAPRMNGHPHEPHHGK